MFRFKVFENGAPARQVVLEGAHLMGSDHIPIRSNVRFENGEIVCESLSRASAAALVLSWPVSGFGRVVLETPRLLDRPQPYNLMVELARGQMMRISLKREDWGLYDCAEGAEVCTEAEAARELLIGAMTAADDVSAWQLAEKALHAGIVAGEALGGLSARVSLARKGEPGPATECRMGCRLARAEVYGRTAGAAIPAQYLPQGMEFISLPIAWREVEPKQGKPSLAAIEPWVRALQARKCPMWGASVISFEAADIPTWWTGTSKNYERLRESAARHLKQVLKALAPHVAAWEVASGLNANNPLRLTNEQIMDLTRIAVQLARQISSKTPIILTIAPPWGDYYASDHQTVPPLLYAEQAAQAVSSFDAFGLEVSFGRGESGRRVRDLMQVSSLLDRFGNLGKPIHVTTAGVPSEPNDRDGSWRGPWTEKTQALWLREFFRMAAGKPFVESIAWCALADAPNGGDHCGLLRADLTPKPAFHEFLAVREALEKSSSL